jgi:uncharacterized protein YneF (UPF0154 family)
MLAIAVVLILVQILLDGLYLNIMFFETMIRENPVPITDDIAASMNQTMVHIGALVVSLLSIALMPLYHKLLLKIDTSILDVDEVNIVDERSIAEEFPDEDILDF